MKKLIPLFSLFLVVSCASSKVDHEPYTITFIRAGGFSGLEERFIIEENGHARKTMRFPGSPETTPADTNFTPQTLAAIFRFVHRNIDSLRTIKLDETGNMTTTLILANKNVMHTIRWPNLEPPVLATKKLDSLYEMITPVQQWLSRSH
jgi:hypothetical protein